MKQTPIIMSGNHPKLILDGIKTMTRRVIKLKEYDRSIWDSCVPHNKGRDGFLGEPYLKVPYDPVVDNAGNRITCPYGQVGDLLWVRETFVLECDQEYGYTTEELEEWKKDRPIKTEDGGFVWGEYHLIPHYRATEEEPNIVLDEQMADGDDTTKWRPSIFMPQWASRITLEITEVRVERVQEISENDIEKEGVSWSPLDTGENYDTISAVENFAILWDSLNAKRGFGWEVNPWVWVISFKLGGKG